MYHFPWHTLHYYYGINHSTLKVGIKEGNETGYNRRQYKQAVEKVWVYWTQPTHITKWNQAIRRLAHTLCEK